MYRLDVKGTLNGRIRAYTFHLSRDKSVSFLASLSSKRYSNRDSLELYDSFQTSNSVKCFKQSLPFLLHHRHFHSLNIHHWGRACKTVSCNTRIQLDNSVCLPIWIVRLLSGKCNGEDNVDERDRPLTDGGEEKQDKDQICTTKMIDQQPDNGSLSSETEQERNSQEPKLISKEPDQQEHSHENQSDQHQQKRKVRNRVQSLKSIFKKKAARRLLHWENIDDSFNSFPYFISEETKGALIDSAGARLKQLKPAEYGKSLPTSSQFILLEGPSGTEIYQEKLIRALAQHLRVSLLVLDSEFLAAKEYRQEFQLAELESDDSVEEDDGDDDDEDQEDEEEREQSKEEYISKNKDVQPIAVLKLLDRLSDLPKVVQAPEKYLHVLLSSKAKPSSSLDSTLKDCGLKIGDRVKFIGIKDKQENKQRSSARLRKYRAEKYLNHERRVLDKSKLKAGQLGVVTSLSQGLPGWVAVNFNVRGSRRIGDGKYGGTCLAICAASDLERVEEDLQEKESLLPVTALCEMLATLGPVIVYFPDIQHWLARAVPETERPAFIDSVGELLTKIHGQVVFICGHIKEDEDETTDSRRSFKQFMEDMWSPLHRSPSRKFKRKEVELAGTEDVLKLFENRVKIHPPKEEDLLHVWKQQLEQQKKITLQTRNQKLLGKVLEEHKMRCSDLSDVDTLDLCLTKKKAEQVAGWARNNYLASFNVEPKKRILSLPGECLAVALSRLRALEAATENSSTDFTAFAENEYEKSLLSSVIPPQKIGVQFDQIGALEDVKKTLKELIILPLQRPELFRKGNLRKPCKGVLLFGPPGTGKTLLAKAVATESGANFINISSSSVTSKWYGDAEKLTSALFTLARKLSPVIIFIDELDGILGARGNRNEHEITRRQRNEFMAAWDGLQSKENERILILATTNRPFDLDDAVIRRLPRRIFIDLPNLETRTKILRTLLAQEELVDGFNFSELATQTEGYSGSDLKNLCVNAAYRPVRELLEAEKQAKDAVQYDNFRVTLRALCLEDFIQAKTMIGASVSYDAASIVQLRQWNEQYGEGGGRKGTMFGFAN